jgi:hypothetical protein
MSRRDCNNVFDCVHSRFIVLTHDEDDSEEMIEEHEEETQDLKPEADLIQRGTRTATNAESQAKRSRARKTKKRCPDPQKKQGATEADIEVFEMDLDEAILANFSIDAMNTPEETQLSSCEDNVKRGQDTRQSIQAVGSMAFTTSFIAVMTGMMNGDSLAGNHTAPERVASKAVRSRQMQALSTKCASLRDRRCSEAKGKARFCGGGRHNRQ